ncbi:MAG: UDP-2,4-diacetamido-2,4,6-trideoxy-beta-L-altropyranose hydrolase [Candidatus Omnitrophica bacterium]|nr:UDP-2,4-diacetamido-2,4,6-trideoxy-beta-L-altropyranose hydrolase [Candidatus Omnitrophota bacterium]
MKILFRADASNRIGVGHLMRCVALAQYFSKQGVEVYFLTATKNEKIKTYLRTQPFKVEFLPFPDEECGSQKDLNLTLQVIEHAVDWVVLDNDYYDIRYQKKIRAAGVPLLVIDDCNKRNFDASILLNHSANARRLDYKQQPETEYLLGPEYALLRQELIKFPQRKQKGFANLLVTMGGSVQSEACEKVLRAVEKIRDFSLHVKVVGGFSEKIQNVLSASSNKIERVEASFEMAKLYDWADLAVCAGGGTGLELCFFSIVGLTGALVEHQTPVAQSWENEGIFIFLGDYHRVTPEEIGEGLRNLIKNPKMVDTMRTKAKKLVDGNGPSRIFQAMCASAKINS